jgi:hypothetical protein
MEHTTFGREHQRVPLGEERGEDTLHPTNTCGRPTSKTRVISPSRHHAMFAALPHPKKRLSAAHHSSSIAAL